MTTVLLLGLGLPGVYVLWASLVWPLAHDAPILHYVAWRIGDGAVPYRDIFDMNQPGVYLVHFAVIRLLGESDLAWRAFDLAWLAWTALAIFAFAQRWGPMAGAGGAVFFAVYHLMGGAWQAGQRDFLLCPLLVAGALGTVRWIESGPRASLWTLAGGGLLLGAGVTIKPHVAALALVLGALALLLAGREHRRLGRPALVYVAALAAPPAAVLGWLAAVGALGAWREIVLDYLVPLYSRLARPETWAFYRWHVWIAIAAGVVVSLISALVSRRFTARHAIAGLGVGYGMAHYFGQGKGWEYHLYPLAAFSGVLLFSELGPALERRRVAVGVPLVASLAAVAVLLGLKTVEAAESRWVWDKESIVRRVVRDVAARIRPGETVQVLDTAEGGIHALLRLHVRQPTRFLYDFHFFHDTENPEIAKLRAEFVRELAAHPPRLVVVFERGWPSGKYERVESFPELARQLETGYTIADRRTWYVVFAKRDGS